MTSTSNIDSYEYNNVTFNNVQTLISTHKISLDNVIIIQKIMYILILPKTLKRKLKSKTKIKP